MQKTVYQFQQSAVKYCFSSNIIGLKYENRFPCDLFLAETQSRSQCHIILNGTFSFHGILGNLPENQRKLPVCEKLNHPGN